MKTLINKLSSSLLVGTLALGSTAAMAAADKNWEAKYIEYTNSIGDATPIGQYEWGVRNGYLPDTSKKERIVLSKSDQAEIAAMNFMGDGTPAPKHVASLGPRKQLTKSEVEYIRFTSAYGDGTPPSYHDWKSSK